MDEEYTYETSKNEKIDLLNKLKAYEEIEKAQRKIIEDLKIERIRRKRLIKVKRVSDIEEKYENYSVIVNRIKKIVILKKPLEMKYLKEFESDCKKLGYKYSIDAS